MKRSGELVMVPYPVIGHLISTSEFAKLLTSAHDSISVTILVAELPYDTKTEPYIQSLSATSSRIRLARLPRMTLDTGLATNSQIAAFQDYIIRQKPNMRTAVNDLILDPSSPPLAGFLVGLFCTVVSDLAKEFRVPCYTYYTSGAAMLGLHLRLQSIRDDDGFDVTDFKESDDDLSVSTFLNPVPVKVLPAVVVSKTPNSNSFLDLARTYRETNGIVVNTFFEFEEFAVSALSGDQTLPPIYPVGPVLNLDGSDCDRSDEGVIHWLDLQPNSSVVFLCFGSRGCFGKDQVGEIARALESSGHRFLWSLRRPPPQGKAGLPTEYEGTEDVLPEGFRLRTEGRGKVIGWAPQQAVLSHRAVGGFVSHCGWNSILESVWFGVPMAAWPMYAEQQVNAFQMVKELGIAAEIRVDHKTDYFGVSSATVGAEEIEEGIKKLMVKDGEMRKKVKELKDKSREVIKKGGSSYDNLSRFVDDVITNGRYE